MTPTRFAIAIIGTELVFAASFAIAGLSGAMNRATVSVASPGWSCVDDGNRVCGPGNAQGAPPACYDEGGVIVAPWPCHVVVNRDGSSDVYTGEVR